MKKLYFVTRGYPTKDNSSFAFIQPLIHKIADDGIECVVVAPQAVLKRGRSRPYKWFDSTEKGNTITIVQPKYLPMGNIKVAGVKLTALSRERAIHRTLKYLKEKPDAVYAHFWDCALMASSYAFDAKVPLIAVSGESVVKLEQYFSKAQVEKKKKNVSGVICVSTKNYKESLSLGLIQSSDRVLISPNAIDTSLFYRCDKTMAREAIGAKKSDFVISYVGRFSERKGVNRLIQAAKHHKDVKLVLIGYGGELDESDQILVAKRVAHEDVVNYLNASDIYCLPTQAEGCCNSIVEAMACGLPIISSDAEFNKDILDESVAILVDPNNISDIENAISTLKNNEIKRNEMADNAYRKAKNMTIEKRTLDILRYIEDVVKNYQN